MACPVPVLLLAFNRPDNTRQVLDQIRLAAPVRLYAHCDGPRASHPTDTENVARVRKLIEDQGPGEHTELKTFFRNKNVGLRKGIAEAISWFFEQEACGIILEDDCLPDQSLFPYCVELLMRYKDDDRIMHIGCSNLLGASYPDFPSSYLFSKMPFVWGWASWRRAWQHMDVEFKDLDAFERNKTIDSFLPNAMARDYIMDKFHQTKAGKINTWDYTWLYSILKNDGLCIVPKVNLVQNTGVGSADATNTRKQNKRVQIREQVMTFPLKHPDNLQVDLELEQQLFFAAQKSPLRLKLWSFLHAIGIR